MKCPYCNTAAHMPWRKNTFEDESSPWGGFSIDHAFCPECGKLIVRLCHSDTCRQESLEEFELGYVDREEVIYPKAVAGKILNDIIPKQYISIYQAIMAWQQAEAVIFLQESLPGFVPSTCHYPKPPVWVSIFMDAREIRQLSTKDFIQ